MGRTDDDSWDIATGVGLTAVTIAASRAAETASVGPLIHDPHAAVLLAGVELGPSIDDPAAHPRFTSLVAAAPQALVDYHAARTRFFDDYFEEAADAGIRQHVILASGLDSRAFRLTWPTGCRVFEIDLPRVLDFKARTLKSHGVLPLAQWIHVGIDLRLNWERALRAAGLDTRLPTAWLAEGLLPFLTGEAQETLFRHMDTLSASGSRVAVEAFNVKGGSLLELISQHVPSEENAAGSSMRDLWYGDEDRSDPVNWWRERGWLTEFRHASDYLAACNRPIADADNFASLATFVTAFKP